MEPKNITGRGRESNHKKLVRVCFWTPYPTRSGKILSRIANISVGQEVTFDGDPDTYVITSASVVNTPVFGLCNEYSFTASPATVLRWTRRLGLEDQKRELFATLAGRS